MLTKNSYMDIYVGFRLGQYICYFACELDVLRNSNKMIII